MSKKIFLAALAALAIAACENRSLDLAQSESESVELEVSIPLVETKAVNVNGEDAVSSYQVFVYSKENGLLETSTTASGTSTSVKLRCTMGQKEIVVLANAPDLSSMMTLDALKQTKSKLENNQLGSLVMEGSKEMTLTASSTVEVQLKRMVSKIRLKEINVAFESEAYRNAEFELISAFLINVPADKKYLATTSLTVAPTEWYNKLKYVQNDSYDSILKDEINTAVTGYYKTEHVFYCYPNPHLDDDFSSTWSERPTRLVVEAKINGKLFYYPVVLPELKQNNIYDVTLKITRPGTDDMNEDMRKYEETFTITVLDWDEGGTVEEIL